MDGTYVGQQLVRGHAGDDEQVAQDDLQVVGPKLTQRAPKLLDVRVGVGKLQRKINQPHDSYLYQP